MCFLWIILSNSTALTQCSVCYLLWLVCYGYCFQNMNVSSRVRRRWCILRGRFVCINCFKKLKTNVQNVFQNSMMLLNVLHNRVRFRRLFNSTYLYLLSCFHNKVWKVPRMNDENREIRSYYVRKYFLTKKKKKLRETNNRAVWKKLSLR